MSEEEKNEKPASEEAPEGLESTEENIVETSEKKGELEEFKETDDKLSKEEVQDIVDSAQKSERQEVGEMARYPGLKLVIRFAKLIGIILAVIFLVLAFLQLFVAEGLGGKIIGFFACLGLALIFGAVGYSIGDLLQLFIDIEENTRKKEEPIDMGSL